MSSECKQRIEKLKRNVAILLARIRNAEHLIGELIERIKKTIESNPNTIEKSGDNPNDGGKTLTYGTGH